MAAIHALSANVLKSLNTKVKDVNTSSLEKNIGESDDDKISKNDKNMDDQISVDILNDNNQPFDDVLSEGNDK